MQEQDANFSNESLTETFSVEKMQKYGSDILDWTVNFIPKLIIALLILYIGFKIVNKLSKIVNKGLEKADLGPEVTLSLIHI